MTWDRSRHLPETQTWKMEKIRREKYSKKETEVDSDAKSSLASFTTKRAERFIEDGQGQNQYIKEVSIIHVLEFWKTRVALCPIFRTASEQQHASSLDVITLIPLCFPFAPGRSLYYRRLASSLISNH